MKYKDQYFWLFITHEDHRFDTGLMGRKFENDWLRVTEQGEITIKGSHVQANGKGGYAWDGCSPKTVLFDIVFGVPDGAVDYATEKPKTYYASMVHDALYQFGRQAGLKRKEIDWLFLRQLGDFKLRYFYYFIVRALGWLFYEK